MTKAPIELLSNYEVQQHENIVLKLLSKFTEMIFNKKGSTDKFTLIKKIQNFCAFFRTKSSFPAVVDTEILHT